MVMSYEFFDEESMSFFDEESKELHCLINKVCVCCSEIRKSLNIEPLLPPNERSQLR